MPSGSWIGRRVPWLSGAALLGVLGVLWAAEPHGQVWYPRCLLYAATGLQCPGCGGLRAAHALLHGDLAAAWHLNPLLICLLPVFAWVGLVISVLQGAWLTAALAALLAASSRVHAPLAHTKRSLPPSDALTSGADTTSDKSMGSAMALKTRSKPDPDGIG